MLSRRTFAPLAPLALVVALAGCGGNGSTGTSGGGSGAQTQRILNNYGRCVRAHGFPDFPDPRINTNGELTLGAAQPQVKQAALQTESACGSILRQLPPRAGQQSGPLTPAQLAQARLFSACMRQHGLPDWPDPRPDGSFPLSTTPYANTGKSGPVLAGVEACKRYDTFGGVRAS